MTLTCSDGRRRAKSPVRVKGSWYKSDIDRVPLKSAITGLRRQIKEAAEQAQGLGPDDVKFRITSIELELTVVAEDSATVGGEVGWWVLKAKADAASKDAITHRVKLSLNVGDIAVRSDRKTE